MDTDFIPRVYVNGAALSRSVGKVVSILVKPADIDSSGKFFMADTTDGHKVRVNLKDVLNDALENWVEVIGIPTAADSIKCREIITFEQKGDGKDFTTKSYDMLVGMLANCPDFYNFGE